MIDIYIIGVACGLCVVLLALGQSALLMRMKDVEQRLQGHREAITSLVGNLEREEGTDDEVI